MPGIMSRTLKSASQSIFRTLLYGSDQHPCFQMRKLSHREIEPFFQCHIIKKPTMMNPTYTAQAAIVIINQRQPPGI